MLGRRGEGEDGDRLSIADQRHEGRALGACLGHETRADPLRACRVVDRKAGGVVDGARDARRLADEVDSHVAPPVDVAAVGASEEAGGLAPVVGDEGEGDELDAEQRAELVEKCSHDAVHVRRPRELVRDPPQALQLALTLALQSSARPRSPRSHGHAEQKADDEGADDHRHALPRQREAVEAERERCDRNHAGRADDTERRGSRRAAGCTASRVSAACKDGPTGPLFGSARPDSVRSTGRCEPRRAYLALSLR